MPDTVTLKEIRDQARIRADMRNSKFWTDAEMLPEINKSLKRVYNFLILTYGDDYYITSEEIASVADQETYNLNSTFLKLMGVDIGAGASPNEWFQLEKFSFAERNTRRDRNWGIHDYRYRLHGNTIRIIPTSPVGSTFRIWYIPTMTELATDSNTVDGVSGFEEWTVIDVAMKMLRSEESDTTELAADKALVEQHIIEMAAQRDASAPEQVVDIESISQDERWAFWTRR